VSDPSSAFDQKLHADLHAELLAEFATETEAWVGERLDRVMARLNAVRTDGVPLAAHCLAIRACTAFTTPAPHIYIGRRLLERLPSDEATAFVLGHEVAHHDLRHLDLFRGWVDLLPKGAVGSLAAAAFRKLSHRMYGPQRESQADQYSVALCLDAGYDGERCLQAFDILENESLNRGDVDGVFGPESLLDPTDPEQGSTAYEIQRWLWIHARRYLPLRERRDIAWAFYRRRSSERGAKATPNTNPHPRASSAPMTATLEKAFGYQGNNMSLPVGDLSAALPFYETVLGFRVVSRGERPHSSAVLARDHVQIGLAENDGDPTQDGCAFHVKGLDSLFAEFKANGLQKELSGFTIEQRGGVPFKVFYVVAPDGLCYWFGERDGG
jgi:catechol 2,3-dioxygenase-like lactoylglutathione lyase family enzyme